MSKIIARFLLVLLPLLFAFVLLLVMVSAAPLTPILPKHSTAKMVKLFMPEGWGFFTRDPREPLMNLYRRTGNQWELITLPNSYFSFGAGRDMRFQGVELATLLPSIKQASWVETDKTIQQISGEGYLPIENVYFKPEICGNYMIVVQEQVPWAWSERRSRISMPFRFVKISVKCR